MSRIGEWTDRHRVVTSVVLWAVALLVTLGCLLYQDTTGPTYPLEGTVQTAKGPVHFKFVRSEVIGKPLQILLVDPPAGVTGDVKFRRYKSDDNWLTVGMAPMAFTFERRGSVQQLKGVGLALPSHNERAGKYEYYVIINDGVSKQFSVTGDKPIYARYKAEVPDAVLLVHVAVIFLSLLFAIRTTLEAFLPHGRWRWMIWATLASLVLGGFVLGPLVQWYAFGVWWSGVPFGWDWTDNKVLFELVAWVVALVLNWGKRSNRWSVLVAGVVTLLIYFIPHSIFGSEYDYTKGRGQGTAG
jgi:hypothetical protein